MLRRDLPDAPSYAKPVTVDPPKLGEPAVSYAGREKVGRLTANRRLEAWSVWALSVQKCYAANKC